MNFYKHHIGDYDADTAHLTWLEDMAYTRLMRLYYRREEPIPADLGQASRLVRATSKQEREAVAAVLNEFFVLGTDGWHNKRCDEEIGAAQAKAEKNREVGKSGGRPRKSETITVPENNHDGFQTEPNGNPSQTPDSRLHKTPKSAEVDGTGVATPAGIVCARLRSAGIPGVNPAHPKLLALLDAGLTADEIVAVGEEARQKAKGFAWILAAAEGRRRDAAATAPLPAKGEPPWWSSNDRMLAKGQTLGLSPRPGEDWPQFRSRINDAISEAERVA